MKRLIIIITLASIWGCSKDNQDQHTTHDHNATTTPDVAQPLHLMLTDNQMRLGNITTAKVSRQPIGQTIVINGRLTENKDLSSVVSSRAAGRIEHLYVKETGRVIQKGEPLYQLYSENLLTLQREFLLAKEQYESLGTTEKRYKSFYDAARRKLTLYGITQSQIDQLAKRGSAQSSVTFLSPASGIVSELEVTDGQYVAEGEILLKIENIGTLWLEAELYPTEAPLAKVGEKIKVTTTGNTSASMEATIDFLSPEFKYNSQITVMRAVVSNPDQKLKPGMQAQVFFTHSSKTALTVPVDAVIRDARGSHVYVQNGRNTFHPQTISIGSEDFDKIEVISGIAEDDTVAVTGAYLLYSELILKNGTDPMKSHQH
jgi:Cu(I)/Ag(I) efflux system membrane fusion protein